MSLSVSREVARNVGEALEILRRPGHDFGREFFLKTGTDPHRDASLLSSTDVLCNANAATNEFEFILPSADDESPSPGPGKMSVAYVQAPLITGTLTCGLCVLMQTSETSFLGMGRIVYFAGRYVRCEATGECLSFVRPFRGGGDTNVRGAVLVYSRRDSPGGHFLMFAVTRLGVAMRQMYDDYERGDQGALYGNFTFLQRGAQIPVDGCSQCGLITARGCNCDLGATMPKTSFDFSAIADNHQRVFGSFRVFPVLYSLQTHANDIENGRAIFCTARGAQSSVFSKRTASPSLTTCSPLDKSVVSHVTTSFVQDHIQIRGPSSSFSLPRITRGRGDYTFDARRNRCWSPDAESKHGGAVRTAVRHTASQGLELEEDARQAYDTGATNQVTTNSVSTRSVQPYEFGDGEHRVIGVSCPFGIPAGSRARFAAARENQDSLLAISEPGLHAVAPETTEFASASPVNARFSLQPATTHNASGPHQHQPLHQSRRLSMDLSTALPLQAENVRASLHCNMSDPLPSRNRPDPPQGPCEAPSGSARAGGTGLERAGENLTRREKNRRAAARSNEKRRVALQTLRLELAKARAEIRVLTNREAEARKLNRQLKEEAARRWKHGASKS